ncbi:STM3941 family protein [Pseudochryseolinea flava]|uniref:Uncharacterized protein n=1 Tax=Pseudochryseolinea flava TaxID=2059302 RepID=A0A364XZ21_9BACT|nr:STM3941 family protein [Pseudochryseolinea flava]RAV99239.1 hypothetical protein DQQ10_20295 [Pseudochryseolinea flava]
MEIKLYKSRWKAIKLILLCSIFVVMGIFLLVYNKSPSWVAWMSIGFFGLGYPVGFFHLFDRRPQIIINEIGIFDRMAYRDFINWDVMLSAYPINIHGQKFICLIVDPKFEPKIKAKKFVKQLNKEIGAQELNISLGQIQIDEKRLIDFIMKMIALPQEARKSNLDEKLLKG